MFWWLNPHFWLLNFLLVVKSYEISWNLLSCRFRQVLLRCKFYRLLRFGRACSSRRACAASSSTSFQGSDPTAWCTWWLGKFQTSDCLYCCKWDQLSANEIKAITSVTQLVDTTWWLTVVACGWCQFQSHTIFRCCICNSGCQSVAGASKRISADLQRCRMVSTTCNGVQGK